MPRLGHHLVGNENELNMEPFSIASSRGRTGRDLTSSDRRLGVRNGSPVMGGLDEAYGFFAVGGNCPFMRR